MIIKLVIFRIQFTQLFCETFFSSQIVTQTFILKLELRYKNYIEIKLVQTNN